jgi:aryl-alcohol dehydrogenase-like predicted oxidoreductase
MRTIRLGHTGVEVSALCLGCMYFGSTIDEATSFQLLDQYRDAGGEFLDTANNYAFWVEGGRGDESERLLGRWMQQRGTRDHMFLATKVGYNTPPRVPISLARQTIIAQCEQSLRQLQTEAIDLYYAHWDHRETPLEEALEAFDLLVRQGKVRFIGCSNILAWRIEQARALSRQHSWAEYCCVQQRHTYLRPKTGLRAFANGHVPVSAELLDYAAAQPDHFTIVAYSTLLGGVYSHPEHLITPNNQPDEYDAADKQARLQMLHAISAETGATPNQVVLAWITQNAPPMVALVSSSSPVRLAESLASDRLNLTPAQLDRLNRAGA